MMRAGIDVRSVVPKRISLKVAAEPLDLFRQPSGIAVALHAQGARDHQSIRRGRRLKLALVPQRAGAVFGEGAAIAARKSSRCSGPVLMVFRGSLAGRCGASEGSLRQDAASSASSAASQSASAAAASFLIAASRALAAAISALRVAT